MTRLVWNLAATVIAFWLIGLSLACRAKAPTVQRPNPASVNCVDKGGKHVAESGPNGQFGICQFPDNRQCEEWALLRGECPAGGIRVTGYFTAAARFCAITGGRYAVTANSGTKEETGTCALPDGRTCDAGAHFRGECKRQ